MPRILSSQVELLCSKKEDKLWRFLLPLVLSTF